MKKSKILIATLFLLGVVISCTDTSKYPIDFDQVNESNGGILKQVIQTSVTFDKTNIPSSLYSVVFEANDRDRGKLFTKVELFVKFVDRTPANGIATKAEKLFKTYQASQFTNDPATGLPRIAVSVTAPETLTFLALTTGDIDGTDQFVFRQAMHFPDGKIFTSTNVNNSIASMGGVFKSPFQNVVSVVCPTDLGGTISYSTINTIAGGGPTSCVEPVIGTTTFTKVGVASYNIGDNSFGVFACAYGDTPAAGVTLNDACNLLTLTGTDQYGDSYTWTIVGTPGATLVINWISTWPDGGITTLTRTGGWPPGLTF